MAKRIGLVPHRYAEPLARALAGRGSPAFDLVREMPARLALKLRRNELDGAFLSPVDLAREHRSYRIVRGAGIVSGGESGSILLFFREHAKRITTLAFDPASSSEAVLAHIVLAEKFESAPKLVPVENPAREGWEKADAVLLVGDAVLSEAGRTNRLDLVDEWMDISDLPFVHHVCVAREGALSDQEISLLGRRAAEARDPGRPGDPQGAGFRYTLDDEAADGLNEFLRMAYYHGILKDIPEVRFFEPGGSENKN